MKKLLILICAGMLIASCGGDRDPENARFETLPGEVWLYGDTLLFDTVTSDSLPSETKVIAVRHTAGYKYSNLWVEVTSFDDDTAYTDTVNIRLADRYGRSLGRGNGISFLKTDTLPARRSHSVALRHVMRADSVGALEQIGVLSY